MMNEKTVIVYIHDLDISNKSKSFLARAGLKTLNDLLRCNITVLDSMRGYSEEVCHELNSVIAHADNIIDYFEKRQNRIAEILPTVHDIPIENLGLGNRSTNALKRNGIHKVGELIQLSPHDVSELRNVGRLSRQEITTAIDTILQIGHIEFHESVIAQDAIIDTLSDIPPEIASVGLEELPLSVRAKNALKREEIRTVGELIQLSETDIMRIRNVGTQTRDEIIDLI